MKPIHFAEANRTLVGPESLEAETGVKAEPLPVWAGEAMVVSCWRPTLRERLSILLFGRVWLNVFGWGTQPPVSLSGCRTYFKPAPASADDGRE